MKQLLLSVCSNERDYREKKKWSSCVERKKYEIDTPPYGRVRIRATYSNITEVFHAEMFEHILCMANMNM